MKGIKIMNEINTIVCNVIDVLFGVFCLTISFIVIIKEQDKTFQKLIYVFIVIIVLYSLISIFDLVSNLWEVFI